MAQYQIRYACGHTELIQLYGKRSKFFAEHGQKLAEGAAVNEYASAFQSYLKGVQEASYWIETRDDPVEWRISKWKEIARKERRK